jgi:hypothetical protein
MQTRLIERRDPASMANPPLGKDRSGIVRRGMLIQESLGTIGAVEFLKAHDVEGTVIGRVLTSRQVRFDDRGRDAVASNR